MGMDLVKMIDSSGRVSRRRKVHVSSIRDRLRGNDLLIYQGNIGRYEVLICTKFSKGKIEYQNLFIDDSEKQIFFYSYNPSKNDGFFEDLRTQTTEEIQPDIAVNRILLSYLN